MRTSAHSRPASSVMSTSHTAVVRPPWRRRAMAWIVPVGDRAQEARLVGDRAAVAGRERVGDHRVDAAVDEARAAA